MARTAAVIRADIDTCMEAVGSGALRVTFTDRMVEYRSISDLQKAISILRGELAVTLGTSAIKRVQPTFSKGL